MNALQNEFGEENTQVHSDYIKIACEYVWVLQNLRKHGGSWCNKFVNINSEFEANFHEESNSTLLNNIDSTGLAMYVRLRESDMVQNTGVYMAADSMLALHFFVKAASPVTHDLEEELEDLLPDLDEYFDKDWEYNDAVLILKRGTVCKIESIKAREENTPGMQNDVERLAWEIIRRDAECRLEMLFPLYIHLPPNVMLKAVAGYTLGKFFLTRGHAGDKNLAERLLYECVYCLDRLEGLPLQNVPIISELGTNALIKYGDALVGNKKYAYGILAYEAAIFSYKIRTKRDLNKLTRRLCVICIENNDFDRALKYHLQILGMAMKERPEPNVNEIVYLSEVISTLQLEQGNFERAEAYLISAKQFLAKQMNIEGSECSSKLLSHSHHTKHSSIYEYQQSTSRQHVYIRTL